MKSILKNKVKALLGSRNKYVHLLHIPKTAGSSIWWTFADTLFRHHSERRQRRLISLYDPFHECRVKFYKLAKNSFYEDRNSAANLGFYDNLYSDLQIGKSLNFAALSSPSNIESRTTFVHWHHPGSPHILESVDLLRGSFHTSCYASSNDSVIIPLRDSAESVYSLFSYLDIHRSPLSRLFGIHMEDSLRIPNLTDLLIIPLLSWVPPGVLPIFLQSLTSSNTRRGRSGLFARSIADVIGEFPEILTFQSRWLLSSISVSASSIHLRSKMWSPSNSEILEKLASLIAQIELDRFFLDRLSVSYLSSSSLALNGRFIKLLHSCGISPSSLIAKRIASTATSSSVGASERIDGFSRFKSQLTCDQKDTMSAQDACFKRLFEIK
jgi:hypothetical protein